MDGPNFPETDARAIFILIISILILNVCNLCCRPSYMRRDAFYFCDRALWSSEYNESSILNAFNFLIMGWINYFADRADFDRRNSCLWNLSQPFEAMTWTWTPQPFCWL